MARSLWSGSLSFGLVNVPVRLVSAARDLGLHFRQLHEPDGVPIDVQRWCSEEEREVPYEELGRSFRFDDGEEVLVDAGELEALEPRRTRTIDIEQFVDVADVDPIYFDHPYLMVPAADDEGALRAYRLLVEVMSRTDRAALGRLVMRTKEYLAIVRVRGGVLALTTMRFHDEVRPADDVADGAGAKPTKAQLRDAEALVEALTVDWDPARYEDRYRERLADVVRRKREGSTIRAPEKAEEPKPVPDIMDALKRSLEAARAGGGSARGAGDGGEWPGAGGARQGDGEDLGGLTRDELYERAQRAGVPGRSSMSKDELADALSG
jgi:DNA end-binding protein Ku